MRAGGPLLKICGIRDIQTARAIAGMPVDYVGFVFADSKRRVSPAEAKVMVEAVRGAGGRQRFVGVFLNQRIEEIADAVSTASLDVIQLHGQEPASLVQACKQKFSDVHIWKALGVQEETDHTKDAVGQRLSSFAGLLDGLLLDAYDPRVGGGTGKTFRWEAIPAYRAWTEAQGIPLFIAGGLNVDNIGELFEQDPYANVDVSSGVEINGHKDIDKIERFVERVKPA